MLTTSGSTSRTIPRFEPNFDRLRSRIETFQSRFDRIIDEKCQQVSGSRTEYQTMLAQNLKSHGEILAELKALNEQESKMAKLRAEQQKDIRDSESSISSYSQKKLQLEAIQEQQVTEMAQLREQIRARRQILDSEEKEALSQGSRNVTEVALWESVLGLRIDSISTDDFLKFVFTCLDPQNVDAEFYFIVDLRSSHYAITQCQPSLSSSITDPIIAEFNRTQDLCIFLRDIRKAFKNSIHYRH